MSDSKRNNAGARGSLSQLADLVGAAGIRLKSDRPSTAQAPARPGTAASTSTPAAMSSPLREASPPSPASEDRLFTEAMQEVAKVSWRRGPAASSPKTVRADSIDPDLEARRLMQQALETATPIEIPDHPEYIEGWVGGAGKRFLPKLRDGVYSIQGQIDLHGLSRVEAEEAVEDYIRRMSRFHSCCVKIIHGRGINSPADKATLKDALQRLLATRRMSRYVVAYASAPSRDGGVGAVYVLLSRQ